MPPRNDWTPQELLLGLDLYFRVGRDMPKRNSPEVQELCALLPHRNPNAILVRVGGYQRLDPSVTATKGATYSKAMQEVWERYGSKPQQVAKLAASFRQHLEDLPPADNGGELEFREGRLIQALHLSRERSAELRQKKIADAKRRGKLRCEVCGFEPSKRYRNAADEGLECHHVEPLSALGFNETRGTKLKDLALLCANCHSVIHRRRPWLTPQQLKRQLIPA
jgi:5-methylcytosine-specific restriction enzyme A